MPNVAMDSLKDQNYQSFKRNIHNSLRVEKIDFISYSAWNNLGEFNSMLTSYLNTRRTQSSLAYFLWEFSGGVPHHVNCFFLSQWIRNERWFVTFREKRLWETGLYIIIVHAFDFVIFSSVALSFIFVTISFVNGFVYWHFSLTIQYQSFIENTGCLILKKPFSSYYY